MAFRGICILIAVVDMICYNLVTAMLRGCTFETIYSGKPLDALNAICERKEDMKILASNFHRIQSQITSDILYHIQNKLKLETFLMSPNDDIIQLTQENDWCVAYLVDPSSIVNVSNFWKMSRIEEISKAIYMSTSSISSASSSSSTLSSQKPASSSVGPSDNLEKKEDVELDKNSRVVWNEELHRKFLNAIHTLLPDEKPVPKRIMELMGVKGLKRKSVTSHLQKYNLRVAARKGKDESSKQMGGFPSLRDGHLNLGYYPRVWYPNFADIHIPPAAPIPNSHQTKKPEEANVPEGNQTPEEANPASTVDHVPEEGNNIAIIPEEGNIAAATLEEEKKEEDDQVSTLVRNFWNQDPPALD